MGIQKWISPWEDIHLAQSGCGSPGTHIIHNVRSKSKEGEKIMIKIGIYSKAASKKAWALSICFGFWGVYVANVKGMK